MNVFIHNHVITVAMNESVYWQNMTIHSGILNRRVRWRTPDRPVFFLGPIDFLSLHTRAVCLPDPNPEASEVGSWVEKLNYLKRGDMIQNPPVTYKVHWVTGTQPWQAAVKRWQWLNISLLLKSGFPGLHTCAADNLCRASLIRFISSLYFDVIIEHFSEQ